MHGRFSLTAMGMAGLIAACGAPTPSSTVVDSADASFDSLYLACVRNAGVDLGHAQVLVNAHSEPLFVKTGIDVEAEVHGPCLERIGGPPAELTTSSWGSSQLGPPPVFD